MAFDRRATRAEIWDVQRADPPHNPLERCEAVYGFALLRPEAFLSQHKNLDPIALDPHRPPIRGQHLNQFIGSRIVDHVGGTNDGIGVGGREGC